MTKGVTGPNDQWDDVIVGSGSAGAVLASRLSERPGNRVLLIEAGPERTGTPRQEPVGMSILTGANWDYTACLGARPDEGRTYPYCVGKVLGGSSSVNGAIALRGLPEDFNAWAAAGNPLWAWRHVLPYFLKLESDADFDGTAHGTSGPVPIRRMAEKDFNSLGTAFYDACRALGLPRLPDLNTDAGVGVGPVPVNWTGGLRMSTAATYLAAAKDRPGLTVLTGCHVTRVLTEGRRASGVEMLTKGRFEQVPAKRVTLSAGAVNTPVILQRSGIGDARRLTELGIPVIADLPGVGENLSEHAVAAAWAVPKPGICTDGDPWHTVLARIAADSDDLPTLTLSMLNNVPTAGMPFIGAMMGGAIGVAFAVMLLNPASRGTVYLRDPTPDTAPVIVLNLLSEPADLKSMMDGARLMWSVIRSAPVASLLDRVVIWTDRMVSDDARLESALRRVVAPQWHASGTAKMGPATDGTAVVDERFRVHQMTGLRVVDASVMPSIPRSTMNLTCMMLAERAAEWMT
jgi:choline dehydrogenase